MEHQQAMEYDLIGERVIFAPPELSELRNLGYTAVDMHYHTNHSDSPTSVRDLLKLAERRSAGVAITDHNQISGVMEAYCRKTGVFLVPGIEISARDGPHILPYFYDLSEMREFYERHIVAWKGKSPYLAIGHSTREILDRSENYNCVAVAAHPYGYFLFNKGVQKCIDCRYMSRGILSRFDGVEAICGNMAHTLNRRAADLAVSRNLGITGGTDGYLLQDLAGVVTCSQADDLEGFLDDIVKKRNIIIGMEKGPFHKLAMGSVVLTRYLKYTLPSLMVHYEQNMPRVRRFFGLDTAKRRR